MKNTAIATADGVRECIEQLLNFDLGIEEGQVLADATTVPSTSLISTASERSSATVLQLADGGRFLIHVIDIGKGEGNELIKSN